jgi:hypothetical protein
VTELHTRIVSGADQCSGVVSQKVPFGHAAGLVGAYFWKYIAGIVYLEYSAVSEFDSSF